MNSCQAAWRGCAGGYLSAGEGLDEVGAGVSMMDSFAAADSQAPEQIQIMAEAPGRSSSVEDMQQGRVEVR